MLEDLGERGTRYPAASNSLVQGERYRFLATDRVKHDQCRNAVLKVVISSEHASITLNVVAIIL